MCNVPMWLDMLVGYLMIGGFIAAFAAIIGLCIYTMGKEVMDYIKYRKETKEKD